MAMAEKRHVASRIRCPADHGVGAKGYLVDCLPTNHTIGPYRPAGNGLANLLCGLAFIAAIIPLREVRFDLGCVTVTRQIARFRRALEWAGQHESKPAACEHSARRMSFFPPLSSERYVRSARVCAGTTPFRFAVPN